MNPSIRSVGASIFFSLAVAAVLACASESGGTRPSSPDRGTIPLWKTVVDATLIPTVISSPTSTPDPSWTSTATPTVTPTASPTPEQLSEREAYCRDHVLPTAIPESGETPTPVPTSPPGIADDEIPVDWVAKMDEIEDWVQGIYEIDASEAGEFKRTVVDDQVWKDWHADVIKDWAEDENSTFHLWEQINWTLTLLSVDSDFVEFTADYQGENYVDVYNPIKREIFIRASLDEFDVGDQLIYVHEYSHHVQNLKYDYVIWRRCFSGDSDASRAITALIEGDASNVEYEYIETVIGWDAINEYIDNLDEDSDEHSSVGTEPVMARYRNEINDFTYSTGLFFVWATGDYLHEFSGCSNCETVRQRIDEAFKKPPFTTEQIYDVLKYFDNEGRYTIDLLEDFMGTDWDRRHGSTVGKSDWVALLAALTGEEGDQIHTQFPEWDGDYGVLLEDNEGRALYAQVVRWRGDGYINRLVDVFDAKAQLTRRWTAPLPEDVAFAEFYVWGGDTGGIAMGVESVPGWHYTMFLAVGPDIESAEKAVFAARDNVTLDGAIMYSDTSATPSN